MFLEDEITPIDAVKLIVNRALCLPLVQIIRANITRSYPNGHHTIMALLQSSDDLKKVMEAKKKLRTCTHKEISNIWITQAKSHEHRMIEHNCNLLMKEINHDGRLRQTESGRIVQTEAMNDQADQDSNVSDGGTIDRNLTGSAGATQPPSVRGHGRHPYRSDRAVRGGSSGGARGGGGKWTKKGGRPKGKPPAGSPLKVDDDVVNAFKQRSKRGEPSKNTDSNGSAELMDTR